MATCISWLRRLVARAGRFSRVGLLILALLVAGTTALHLVEGKSLAEDLLDALLTIVSAGGHGLAPSTTARKLVMVALLLTGGGSLVYLGNIAVQLAVEGELAGQLGGRRMRSRIDRLSHHFIVCGFGRVGEEIAADLQARSLPFVIVELRSSAAESAVRLGYLVTEGDATLDDTLTSAGVRRAGYLIAAADSDANNTYITLSAKALNPAIFIVARTSRAENAAKLRLAGADRVVTPSSIAGRHMALAAIQPLVFDFFQEPGGDASSILAQLEIGDGSGAVGKSIAELLQGRKLVTILGLRRSDGQVVVGPHDSLRLSAGDGLIVLGPEQELEQIRAGRTLPQARRPP